MVMTKLDLAQRYKPLSYLDAYNVLSGVSYQSYPHLVVHLGSPSTLQLSLKHNYPLTQSSRLLAPGATKFYPR